jgi:hydroxylaminobenzene mutase
LKALTAAFQEKLETCRAFQQLSYVASPKLIARQGLRLLQLGVVLFLFTSFEGFAIPYFAVPNLGRSVHTLSGFVGVLLLALGLVWPRLHLGAAGARVAFWFLIYSAVATIAGFLIAGVWGAGSSIMPLAAGGARGSDFQETVIQIVMYPAAPTGIISFALILWGLRGLDPQPRHPIE